MAARFTLEKRTNKSGECPIRVSWTFGDFRYQTTLGFSVKVENWDSGSKLVKPGTLNSDFVSAEDINHYIKRIKSVVKGIEAYYRARNGFFLDCWMKEVMKDVKSSNFHSPIDIIDKWTLDAASTADTRKRFYRKVSGEYYIYVCNAFDQYIGEEFYILREMSGNLKNIVVPIWDFQKVKDHTMWASAKFEEVTEDEALGRIPRKAPSVF